MRNLGQRTQPGINASLVLLWYIRCRIDRLHTVTLSRKPQWEDGDPTGSANAWKRYGLDAWWCSAGNYTESVLIPAMPCRQCPPCTEGVRRVRVGGRGGGGIDFDI